MWALSRENILERSEFEIGVIFSLIRHKMPRLVAKFQENNIRFDTVGDLTLLPDDIQESVKKAKEDTA